MSAPPRVLFVVNAGARVGGGHVIRALALAGALAERGAPFVFAGPPAMGAILDAFAPGALRLVAASASAPDISAAITGQAFDAVVFDHFDLGERDHRAIAQRRPTLVVDEMADRPLGAHMVLDCGPARRAQDYEGLLAEGARLLLGPQFAPVRPAFAELRETALAWRGEPVQRILISLGLTDLDGITSRVVERLRPRIRDEGIDIVLGARAPSLPGLTKVARRDNRLALHVDTPHMARLTAEADIAIGAPGSAAWERCVLGLPTLTLILADNQRPAAQALSQMEAALVIDPAAADFDNRFDRALIRLLTDADLRRQLALRSAEVCDGLGAARTADAFLALVTARGR